ncbi:MAG: response regulator [Myxococcales bacterium]|nr:response regulator [Myxococcales bacterium]
MVRSAVGRVLTDEGYTVEFAGDGAAALERLAATPPDAILLDLMMPGMNGRQFLHALRRDLRSSVPVVVMTAVHGLGQRAISLGATDVVEKPFDVEELLNKVALAVFRARQESTSEIPLDPPREDDPDHAHPDVVVVVDDDLTALRRLDERLTDGGFTVIALPSVPADAARMLRALAPAAIVVAAAATADGGAGFAATVRDAPSLARVPIIVLSRGEHPRSLAPAAVVLTRPTDDDVVRIIELMSSRPITGGGARPAW